jgi:hypothetical protein
MLHYIQLNMNKSNNSGILHAGRNLQGSWILVHKKICRRGQIEKLNGAGDGIRTRDSLLGRQELFR